MTIRERLREDSNTAEWLQRSGSAVFEPRSPLRPRFARAEAAPRGRGPRATRGLGGSPPECPGEVLHVVVTEADERTLMAEGGPEVVSEVIREAIEREGLAVVLDRLRGRGGASA